MISKKMVKALNEQVNAELFSAYLYLSMEAHFKSLNLNGFANWMRVQTQEEISHAMKIYGFIDERGGRITLKAIEGPQTKWDSPPAVFKDVYKHEQKVTSLINDLVDLAIEEKDHATNTFLQWFVNEQVEEEATFQGLLDKLNLVRGKGDGLLMLDKELSTRVFTPPVK